MRTLTHIRGIVRRHSTIAILAAIVLLDQLTKALFSQSDLWDPGTSVLSPFILGTKICSPMAGAWGDAGGVVLLVIAWVGVLRRTHGWTRISATVLLGGLTSNAADRLGLTGLVISSGGGRGRGVPNWIGWWNVGNAADIAIDLGVAGLFACMAVGLWRCERAGKRPHIPRPSVSMRQVVVTVVLVAVLFFSALAWTATWAAATDPAIGLHGVSAPTAQVVGGGS